MSRSNGVPGGVTRWRELGGRPHGETGVSSAAFWLYAGHLAALVALALSNVLLALAALVSPWREVRRRLPVARDLLITIGVYLLLLGGSIAASYDPAVSLGAASDLFNFLVPIVALLVVRDTRRARLLIRILIVVGTLIAGMALYQYSLAANHLEQRATGPFSHYMTLGSFLVLVDCFLVAWMAFGGGWRRWWSWVCFLLIQAALLVSYTRNAWIALALVLVLVTAVRAPRLLALWAPVVLLVVLLAPSSLLARFGSIFDLTDQSNYDRLCMGYAGLHMIVDKPVFGQGPGMVSERYPIYRHPTAPRQEVPHLHNSFLNLAAERGVASLATLLALLALPAARAVRSLRSARRQGAGAAADVLVATLLVVLTTLVTGLFEDYWSDTEIQRLVLFALALPYCLAAERSADGEPVEAS